MGSAVPIDDLIRMRKPYVLVLEVRAVAVGTQGQPPRARVRILEVLFSDGKIALGGEERDAIFAPDGQGRFYAIRGGGDEGLAEWNAQPFASPASGAHVIVAADLCADGALDVWERSVRPDDPTERVRLCAFLAQDA